MSSAKKSVFWAAIEQIGPQIAGFGISIVLARLLTPADYGLIGMIAVFTAFAQLFSDVGMSQALIQRKSITADDTKSVYFLNIALGVAITFVLIAISPVVSWFFDEPKLMPIMSVLAVGYTLSSFGIVQYALLSRELNLQKTAQVSIYSTIAMGIVSITMALQGLGVWSLVGGSLAGIVARVIALWLLSKWRPRGKFSMESVKSMWKFSGNLLGAGLFTTMVDNLANILIGRSYSAANLGLYTRANQLQLLPVSMLTGIINRVAFPLFSRNQDDKPALLRQLRLSVKGAVFLASFICILLVVIAEPIVPFLFGDQWLGSIDLLKILSVAGIFFPINVLLITLIKSMGRSDLFLKVEITKKVIIMIALLITSQISIEAMAWSLIFTGAVAYFFNSKFAIPLVDYTWRQQFADLLPAWILLGAAGFITYFIFRTVVFPSHLLELIALTSFYSITTLAAVYLLRNIYFKEVWSIGIGAILSIKNRFL